MNIEHLQEDEFFKSKRRKRRSSNSKARGRSARISARNRKRLQRTNRKIVRRTKKNSRRIQRGKKPRYAVKKRLLNPIGSKRRVKGVIKRSTRRPYSRSTAKRILRRPTRIYRRPIKRIVTSKSTRRVVPLRTSIKSNLNQKIRPINVRKAGIRPVQTIIRSKRRRIKPAVKNLRPVKVSQIKTDHIGQITKKRTQSFGRKPVNRPAVKKAALPVNKRRKVLTKSRIKTSGGTSKVLEKQKTTMKKHRSNQGQIKASATKLAPIVANQSQQTNGAAGDHQSTVSNRSKYLVFGGLALLTVAVGIGVFKYVNAPAVTIS